MKRYKILVMVLLSLMLSAGCGTNNQTQESPSAESAEDQTKKDASAKQNPQTAKLQDGVYTAEFTTDSSMFHINEAYENKGTLTVENGEMTIHITLGSKKILNLYPGLAEDAAKDGAELLLPTEDTVTYSDGMTEEVYGFDVPVPVLDTEFDLALIGTKGKWYDHKVRVSNPVVLAEDTQANDAVSDAVSLEDGTYRMEITFEGGSGKAEILSPVTVTVADGVMTAAVQWNSPNYDYMIVDGKKYLPVNTEGDSVFEIPVLKLDEPMDIVGDTVAMSKPHEIEYTITFHLDTAVTTGVETGSVLDEEEALVCEKSLELQYAQNFAVDYYEDGSVMLTTTMDGARFFVVPERGKVPLTLDQEIPVLRRPVKDLYLVASSAMDFFRALDGLDAIAFSGQKEDGWYMESVREEMRKGKILYAGKYSKPDYELLVSHHCVLAIENRMISHAPQVVQNLESFGIPVMTDYSSYESHPLGRVEWVKFYGALLGKEAEAEKIFSDQEAILEKVIASDKTDKTVAFFFITSNGLVQVRQPSDYIAKIIELAGGNYIFRDTGVAASKRSTINMQVEEFYAAAKDADYLIYNSSIDGGVSSIEELLDQCGLLADFKAVKDGNVWCTTNDMYQQPLAIASFMEDVHRMLQGAKDHMHYLNEVG